MSFRLDGYKYKETAEGRRYKCPCCRNYTFKELDNFLSRCPVCFWGGLREEMMEVDRLDRIEELELDDAQWTYYGFGACDLQFLPFVRNPEDEEIPNICDEAKNLTDESYEFIRTEFGISKDEFCKLSEDELDDYYEKFCDIEVAECCDGDEERCEKAADIVTILGDVYAPIRRGATVFDAEDVIDTLKTNETLEEVQNGLNNAGWDLQNGITTGKPDIEQAIVWYEKAIGYGSIVSMINLGNIYEDMEDYEQAYQWYLEAALAENEIGMLNVANMYFWGWHVNQDYEKAYGYFKKLAEKEVPDAFYYLGLYEENGYLKEADLKSAQEYYEKAIELGDAEAATNLGRMYCTGEGLASDYEKGLELYKLAAGRGDALAYANIGYCYEVGQGVEKDIAIAKLYYSKGAEVEEEHCLEALERLANNQ